MQRLAEGETGAALLAGEARGGLRKKEAQLREALAGQLAPLCRFLLRRHLEHVELLRRQLDEINQALAPAMQEHTATLARLIRIPGVDLTPRKNCWPRLARARSRSPRPGSSHPGWASFPAAGIGRGLS